MSQLLAALIGAVVMLVATWLAALVWNRRPVMRDRCERVLLTRGTSDARFYCERPKQGETR